MFKVSKRQMAWARQRRSATMVASACCFCGRTVDQLTHIVKGPDCFICDICVDACVDTLATKYRGWRERQIDYLLRLRNQRTPVVRQGLFQGGSNIPRLRA